MAKLTPIGIANLKAKAQRYEISDSLPGLRICVFPSGEKSYVLRFRFRGTQKKLTLGRCLIEGKGEREPTEAPELSTPLSLAAARELATKALRQARAGADPCAAKQQAKAAERAAESDTLAAIAAEYLRREGGRLRTVTQRRSDLALICTGGLGQQKIAEITRGRFTHALDRIADKNGPVRSDRCLSALRTLLTWHARRSDFVSPLVPGGRRTSTSERARSRVLSDDELRRVWTAAEQDQGPFGPFVRFVLLTATRRNEAGGLHRSELSDDGKTWIIPGARYKNGKDTLIPLSKAAQKIVADQPVLAGDFVFTADGRHALGGFAERKTAFDQVCGVTGWVIHDLRRTARTLLSRAGIPADLGEMCLGHALGGVRGIYDRHSFEREKSEAFEALAAQIRRITHPPADTVVPISRAKSGRRK
jgi:integrase